MPERNFYWGADETDAQFRTGDDPAEDRFVLAEDTDGGTILLEWDDAVGEWVSRGPVNLSGNDLTGVGALDATSVTAENLSNIKLPPGGDLADYIESGVAITLRPGGDYTLSEPITTDERGAFALIGLSEGELTNNRPTVTYTGDKSKGPIYLDGSYSISKMTIENVEFDANGADYGAYIRWWTNDSVLRDVTLSGFSDTTKWCMDISREIYGRLERVSVIANANVGGGVHIHDTENGVTHLPISGLRAQGNGSGSGKGVFTEGLAETIFYNPVVEDWGEESFRLDGTQTTVIHPYVETFGADLATPVGMEIAGSAAIMGGHYSGNETGGKTVHVASGATGTLMGGRFSRNDVDYHVQNESTEFMVNGLTAVSNAQITSFDSATPLWVSNGTIEAPLLTYDGTMHFNPEDLTTKDPLGQGYEAYHDGSGTPSASKCFAVDGTTWYNIRDGNTF